MTKEQAAILAAMEANKANEAVLNSWKKFHSVKKVNRKDSLVLSGIVYDGMVRKVDEFLNEAGGKPVTLKVNSPGGDYFAGNTIRNMLMEYEGEVTTVNYGLAASAAANIFLAGDKRQIFKDSELMIHGVLAMAYGNAEDFKKLADELEKSTNLMIDNFYLDRFDLKRDEIVEMMNEERMIDGKECVECGAATGFRKVKGNESEEEEMENEYEEDPDEKGNEETDPEDDEDRGNEGGDSEDDETREQRLAAGNKLARQTIERINDRNLIRDLTRGGIVT